MNEYPNIERHVTITSDHLDDEAYRNHVLFSQIVTASGVGGVEIVDWRGRRGGKTTAAINLLVENALVYNAGGHNVNLLFWTSRRGNIDLVAFPLMCKYLDARAITYTVDELQGAVSIANSTIYFGLDEDAKARDYKFAVKDEWRTSRAEKMKEAVKLLLEYGVDEEQLDELLVMAKLARND